jgi:hypothetical protein
VVATNAGTGTVIPSWGGCAVVLTPLPIGSSADLRRRAGAVRSRPLAAWPLEAGLVSSPQIVVGRQIGLPVGVGTPLAVSCAARVCSVTPPAAYAANSSETTTAATGSTPTAAGSRGRSGCRR